VHRWLHPPKPLVAFSHPQEDSFAFVWFVGGDDSEMDRQDREHEEIRLSSLSVSYLIENKDSTAVRPHHTRSTLAAFTTPLTT
jgi:hypothetical protein